MSFVQAVATRAETMWQGAKQVGFDWLSLIMMLLGFIQDCRNPDSEKGRQGLLKAAYLKCINNGVDRCIECCCPEKQAKKLRKKLARKKGLKTAQQQDQHIFNAVMAANVERDNAVKAMTSAYDKDESDDDEE